MSFLGLFGDEKPRYDQYARQLSSLSHTFDPYTSYGKSSLGDLVSQYQRGIRTPQFLEDELSQAYKMSPYAKSEEKELIRVLNNQAALQGKLGSTYAATNLADELHRLISSDMDKYIGRGMGTYGQALGAYGQFPRMGLGSLENQASLGQAGAQASLQGALSRDRAKSSLFGLLGSLGTNLLGHYLGPSSFQGGYSGSSSVPSISINPSTFAKFAASGAL